MSLPGDATRTYVSGLANVGVGDIVHGDIWGYTSASYYVEGPAPYGGVVVANTTNLFPSPVGDLGVLRGTLQAIGGM